MSVPASQDRARARRRGYDLTAGVLLVMLLGGTLPVPLYVLYERQMGFGPLGVTVVFAAYPVAVRTFGAASAPSPPCAPSDSWCRPEELADRGLVAARQSARGR